MTDNCWFVNNRARRFETRWGPAGRAPAGENTAGEDTSILPESFHGLDGPTIVSPERASDLLDAPTVQVAHVGGQTDGGPVFVDRSGRRRRRLRWAAYLAAAVSVAFIALVGMSLAAGPVVPLVDDMWQQPQPDGSNGDGGDVPPVAEVGRPQPATTGAPWSAPVTSTQPARLSEVPSTSREAVAPPLPAPAPEPAQAPTSQPPPSSQTAPEPPSPSSSSTSPSTTDATDTSDRDAPVIDLTPGE